MTNVSREKTENKAFIVGILKEKHLEFKENKGMQVVTGYLILECNTPLGLSEVKVRVYQNMYTKQGKPNTLYKGLQTVSQEYKASLEFGENADTIKVEGRLEDNFYYSTGKNDFIEGVQLNGVFFNRVDAQTPHCCKVAFEGYIAKVEPAEMDLNIELIGIGNDGVAVPVKCVVPQNLVGAFQGRYNVGCTATLNIAILNTVKTEMVQEEVGFGEGIGEVITKTTRKLEVFGGGLPIYMGSQGCITEEEVKQGLAIREVAKEKEKDKALNNSADTSMQTGFALPQAQGTMGAQGTGTGMFAQSAGTGTGFQMPTGTFGGFAG